MYATLANLKEYLGSNLSVDDLLLTSLLSRAQAQVDHYCQRIFEAAADSTRKYSADATTNTGTLLLGTDLCQITSIKTDADTASPITIPSTAYVTLPRNITPYYAIVLKSAASYSWQYTTYVEDAIEIIGRFAYSLTAPFDIVHATIRLAGYFYRQKDSQVFDVVAQPDLGVMTIPQGIPKDVKQILDIYRRPW